MIKLQKKTLDEWTAVDFVLFFKSKYEEKYGKALEIFYGKDATIMKRLIQLFKKHDRPASVLPDFMTWAFATYSSRPEFTLPLTIGFLPYLAEEYLQVKIVSTKKEKTKAPPVSSEMKAWLEQQREIYKHGSY